MDQLLIAAVWGIIGLAFAVATVRRGSLSVGGALMALVLAAAVLWFQGGLWLAPLLVFFLSSTLIGRLLPVSSAHSDGKDQQARDALQVISNGAAYVGAAVFFPDPRLMLIAMSVATADTWASEIGRYFRNPTYDMLSLKRLPPGVSGGVSVSGSLGGLAGAAVIALLGFFLVDQYVFDDFLLVTTVGTAGMFLDSVIGSAWQARYQVPGSSLRDTSTVGAQRVSGYTWMTNDLVNLLATITTTALAAVLLAYR